MRGILKRKFAEVDDEDPFYSSSPPSSSSSSPPSPASTEWDSDDGESSSSEFSQDFTTNGPASSPASQPIRSILKRPTLDGRQSSVRFDLVTVFSFPRCQGFTSVPSRGGASLGMSHRHSTLRRYTMAEHALEQRSWRRERLRERRREETLEALRHKLIVNGTVDQTESERLTADQVPDGDTDVHITDAELEDGSFLQPYSYKHRQALLRAAGVKHIDKEEKRQLHALRVFREDCGCNCQGFCEPETCECSLAGIKCQMDNSSFPCGCTKDGCANIQGRVEFNSRRVQTHYIHTVMRLELERQLQDDTPDQPDLQSGAAPEDLQSDVDPQGPPAVAAPEKSCPFGFSAEDEGLPLTMPPTPSFHDEGLPLTMPPAPSYHFSPERSVVEENSCSSDMTDSSCSSSQSEDSDDVGGSPGLVDTDDGGLAHALSLCDCENDNRQPRHHVNQPLNSGDTWGPLCASNTSSTYMDNNISRASMADCLDENANQATDFLSDGSLDDFPNTPSPSVDYSSGSYMDLSLSSDSDLEFFNTDYASGPLHNSFKGHRHPDNLRHLQLLSPSSPPRYDESGSTCLLESLIGLSEPSPEEQAYPCRDDNQFWEVIQ